MRTARWLTVSRSIRWGGGGLSNPLRMQTLSPRMQTLPPDADPPPPNGQTNTRENITFANFVCGWY